MSCTRNTRGYVDQSYIQKLARMAARGELERNGHDIADVAVAHDDGCPALKGGLCCCDPDITVTWRELR